ncbi:hypothetical protein HJ526_03810 [Donghicola sp. C2-DW-16]|uniref:Aminoglycoside phosphotransferase domain-containing protein n=1 Tax=Donghicola mangrovi TaxID=2729614 RepID=A0ABX2PAN7_9RHOB|nr:hypothetical protein [Donghicola mangrovi]NVO26535.1 hypothetical protein [Donghicola mangrovi]
MPNWFNPQNTSALIADIMWALTSAGLSDRASVTEIIKDDVGGVVAAGEFNGQPAIFKMYRGPDAGQVVQNAANALGTYAARLTGPDVGIVRPLATLPEAGILVMTRAPGQMISRLIGDRKVDQIALIERCARWLTACAAGDMQIRRLAPGKFVTELEEAKAAPDALTTRLITVLKQQKPPLRGYPLIWGPTHGDFSPVNLADDGQRLTAFDVQGVPGMPLTRVAAFFLVSRDLNRAPPRQTIWGLDAATTEAFLNALPPEIGEDTLALKFFVGHAMGRRWLGDSFVGKGRANAEKRIRLYLQS